MRRLPPDLSATEEPQHDEDTPEENRSRRAAIIWLICFVGGVYVSAAAMGLWLWLSGRLSF